METIIGWKNQSEGASERSNITSPSMDKENDPRVHKCLACSGIAPDRRPCNGKPVCKLCWEVMDEQAKASCCSIMWSRISPLLNLNFCFEMCQTSCQTARLLSETTTKLQQKSPNPEFTRMTSTFTFTIRVNVHNFSVRTHNVTLYPNERFSEAPIQHRSESINCQPPFVDIEQLDQMIIKGVWGVESWTADNPTLPPREGELWSAVKLFIGYLAVLRNLSNTSIKPSNTITAARMQEVASEIVYAIMYQLHMLYHSIIFGLEGLSAGSGNSMTASLIHWYSYEALYRFLKAAHPIESRRSTWEAEDSITKLERHFNERVEHVLRQILWLECSMNGELTEHQRGQLDPPLIVERGRGESPFGGFLTELVVILSQNENDVPRITSTLKQGQNFESEKVIDVISGPKPTSHCVNEHLAFHQNSSSVNQSMSVTPVTPSAPSPLSSEYLNQMQDVVNHYDFDLGLQLSKFETQLIVTQQQRGLVEARLRNLCSGNTNDGKVYSRLIPRLVPAEHSLNVGFDNSFQSLTAIPNCYWFKA